MTYTESIKSGHIAVWDENGMAITNSEAARELKIPFNQAVKFNVMADIYAVNAINKMIDSAGDV